MAAPKKEVTAAVRVFGEGGGISAEPMAAADGRRRIGSWEFTVHTGGGRC